MSGKNSLAICLLMWLCKSIWETTMNLSRPSRQLGSYEQTWLSSVANQWGGKEPAWEQVSNVRWLL